MILLTDAEIEKAWRDSTGVIYIRDAERNVAKAQLRRVAEWGFEDCPHDTKYLHFPKHKCGECWAELKREAGL